MFPEELFTKSPGEAGSWATTVYCTLEFFKLREPVYVAFW
jgi:hypothetical protein